MIKYNIEVNPARLRLGTILVVPLARGKYTVGVVTIQLSGVTQFSIIVADKAISSAVKAE